MVFKDEEVSSRILSVINDAKKYVVIVSPYVHLWGHARNALELANKRGVDVTFLVRADSDILRGADVKWLVDHRVDVRSVDRLHAKVYVNENTTILSSMNLLESSSKNSLEIGILVRDDGDDRAVREYIDATLMKLAKPLGQYSRTIITAKTAGKPRTKPTTAAAATKATTHPRASIRKGICIRCKRGLDFDPERPLCDKCYQIWARYSDEEYEEEYCHRCGKEAETSYVKPLCWPCYKTTA